MTNNTPDQAQLWKDDGVGALPSSVLRPTKTIRIAVSGDVLLTELEIRLIDTRDFQRLRGVRQLGTACLVYPTSLHTRFDHALGTLAMAARMVNHIRTNRHNTDEESSITPLQEVLVRLYALLHDVPHIPYGHTLEDELNLLKRHDENEERLNHFFGPDSEIGKKIVSQLGPALGRTVVDKLLQIYGWDKSTSLCGNEFIHDIVSNTVCADLLDYLARDNHFCNLGVPLEYRFLNFLYLHRRGAQKRVFVRLAKHRTKIPRRDTLTDLCRLLETRYLIAERVYFHHAKIASSAMIGRAVHDCIRAQELSENGLYNHTDDSLIQALAASEATVAAELGQSVRDRRLYKELHKYQRVEFDGVQGQDHSLSVLEAVAEALGHPRSRTEFEDRVAEEIGAKKGSVLVYCPPEKMNLKIARMNVMWKGRETEFGDIDDPIIGPRLKEIISAHRQLWGVWLLGSRALDNDQGQLAEEAFRLEFLTPPDQKATRRREYHRHLVDRALRLRNRKVTLGSTRAYQERRDKVVDDMVAIASDNRAFEVRLEASLKRHFRSSGRAEDRMDA